MEMHPYFTEIPLRSFDAMAFEGNLSEVLLALIVDPDEAADVAMTIQEIEATRIELAFDGKIIDAPITLSDFQNLPSKHAFEQLKITLAQWVMTTKSADIALRVMTAWDRRFGVWCACAVAREALHFVPRDELRPLRAIETTEAWVRGMATATQAYSSFEAAYAAATTASVRAASYAADAAAYSAYSAYSAVYAAAHVDAVAFHVADAVATSVSAFAVASIARSAEIISLRKVVANACMTFPG